MKIYKMSYSKKGEGFLGTYSKDSTYWALSPREGAEIVFNENDCKYYDKWYAIEKQLEEDMSVEEILEVMHKKLSLNEIKQLTEADDFLKKMFLCYLTNPMCSSDYNEKLEEIRKTVSDAEGMASYSIISNIMD